MENEIINYIVQNKEKYYRIAYSYTKNKEDALDIIQDAIVKALKYQHTLKEPLYVNAWFCRILINTAKSHLQKQNRYIDVEDELLENLIPSQSNDFCSLEIEEALDQLSYNEKTIILLRYFEEFELKEVADTLGQNLNTVKSTLYRSLKKLNVLLKGNKGE